MDIRIDIQNDKKVNEVKRLGREFLKDQLLPFIDLRLRTLKLIEYGLVWLYFERKTEGSEKNKGISRILKKLRSLLDSITSQVMNCDDLKIQEDLASLHESYSKALTMF